MLDLMKMWHNFACQPIGYSIISPFLILYTEIDWVAYMQQVEIFLNGTLDYDKLEGQTGPCVYPAGFIYIYSLLYWLTNKGVLLKIAQYVFMGIYIVNLLLVFNVYRLSRQVPPFVLFFMCLVSYRMHSIYLLRLFNDPLTTFFVFGSINALLYNKFSLGSLLFSISVSIKMNALFFAPGLLVIFLWYRGIMETIGHLCECFIVQLLLGAPFLFHNPMAYLTSAFNFGRQFMFKWTVNWRLIPESLFLNKYFHLALLLLHLTILLIFLFKFVRSRGGIANFLMFYIPKVDPKIDPSTIIYPMFVSNFIGIMFSRSLHYQFYVWYFYTLGYLLWSIKPFSNTIRLLIFGLIEICWNTYPSTVWSSALLHVCHLSILFGLLFDTIPIIVHTSKTPNALLDGNRHHHGESNPDKERKSCHRKSKQA